jgi:hypothetical protein
MICQLQPMRPAALIAVTCVTEGMCRTSQKPGTEHADKNVRATRSGSFAFAAEQGSNLFHVLHEGAHLYVAGFVVDGP